MKPVRFVATCLLVGACAGTGGSPSTDDQSRPGQASDPTVSPLSPAELSREAERILAGTVPDTGGRFVAAVLVVDVEDGRALVDVRSDGQPDSLADRQRPSGSTLKLLVDAAAADSGATADDGIVAATNCSFDDGVIAQAPTGTPIPATMTIRDATARSVNCAFAKLVRAVGEERMARTVRSAGITRDLDMSTGFAIGANTISMQELGTAVSRLVRSADAGTLADMTRDVLTTGTAAGHQIDGHDVIAKTGTAERNTDAWIFGATPTIAVVVWVGNPSIASDSMSGGVVPGLDRVRGGNLPADIFQAVMTSALTGRAPLPLPHVTPERDPVLIVDPTSDCGDDSDRSTLTWGEPGPQFFWLPVGVPASC